MNWGYLIIFLFLAGTIYPPIMWVAAGLLGLALIAAAALNAFAPAHWFWPKEARERYLQKKRMDKQRDSL